MNTNITPADIFRKAAQTINRGLKKAIADRDGCCMSICDEIWQSITYDNYYGACSQLSVCSQLEYVSRSYFANLFKPVLIGGNRWWFGHPVDDEKSLTKEHQEHRIMALLFAAEIYESENPNE